jgi:hypothetical protein
MMFGTTGLFDRKANIMGWESTIYNNNIYNNIMGWKPVVIRQLAGAEYSTLCTLLAAARQLTLASCRAAARGELAGAVYTMFSTLLGRAGRRPASGCDPLSGCGARGSHWRRLLHPMHTAGRRLTAGCDWLLHGEGAMQQL